MPTSDETTNRIPSGQRVLDRVDTPVDHGEVLRYLGYPVGKSFPEDLQETLDRWIDEAARRASPKAICAVFRVESITAHSLRLANGDGPVEFTGSVGGFLGPCRQVAAFIGTAGPGVERLATELMQEGELLPGLIVNSVGAERAEAAAAAVIDQLRGEATERNLGLTLPYSPGYCGLALTEQKNLFALVSGEPIGVTLSPECLMVPLKSVSGLIGLGPAGEVSEEGSPCARCALERCHMRR
ncbi:MAG: vitamin B12 dependent-methionine synthase activation domain-containing protein [Pirellulales bacterium]